MEMIWLAQLFLLGILLSYCHGQGDGFIAESDNIYRCQTRTLVNIDYLGTGYNIIKGNPHNRDFDPGFKLPIIKLDYKEDQKSSDGKWTIPDNVHVLQTQSSSIIRTSEEIKDISNYQDLLSLEASVEGGGWGVKFSASADYNSLKEGLASQNLVFFESVAKSIHYNAKLKDGFQLTKEFKLAIDNLPTNNDENLREYYNVLERYGTHFVYDVVLGAKFIVRSQFKSNALLSLKQKGINVGASIGASFGGFSGGFSASTSISNRESEEIERSRESYQAIYLGSQPPLDGKWETWAEQSSRQPYPVKYSLREISKLISPRYFHSTNQTELCLKKKLMSIALAQYCDTINGCTEMVEDKKSCKMGTENCMEYNSFPSSLHNSATCGHSGKCDNVVSVLNSIKKESYTGCLEQCKASRKCNWITFDPKSKTCELYADCPNLSNLDCPNCISGEKRCNYPVCWQRGQCAGEKHVIHAEYNIPNKGACLHLCKEFCRCNWFTFYEETRYCILMEDCPSINQSECSSCITGEKSCIAVIDGGWSSWTSYGECSATCGTEGWRRRSRVCNNPVPSIGGSNCLGNSIETIKCDLPPCYECYTNGGKRPNTKCSFPFVFGGKTYRRCTSHDSDAGLWCSTATKSNYHHIEENWGYCGSDCFKPSYTVDGHRCVFPFTYKKKTYLGCADVDSDGTFWCSTKVDENGVTVPKNWGYCR